MEKAEFMVQLVQEGLIGTKEFRNWLAENDSTFASIRDADLDREIELMAESRMRFFSRDGGDDQEEDYIEPVPRYPEEH